MWKTPVHDVRRKDGRFMISRFVRGLRALDEYQSWRRKVLKRDGHACVWCGSGKALEVDHIEGISAIVRRMRVTTLETALKCQRLWDVTNGRTLCVECHARRTEWQRQGKKDRTRMSDGKRKRREPELTGIALAQRERDKACMMGRMGFGRGKGGRR